MSFNKQVDARHKHIRALAVSKKRCRGGVVGGTSPCDLCRPTGDAPIASSGGPPTSASTSPPSSASPAAVPPVCGCCLVLLVVRGWEPVMAGPGVATTRLTPNLLLGFAGVGDQLSGESQAPEASIASSGTGSRASPCPSGRRPRRPGSETRGGGCRGRRLHGELPPCDPGRGAGIRTPALCTPGRSLPNCCRAMFKDLSDPPRGAGPGSHENRRCLEGGGALGLQGFRVS